MSSGLSGSTERAVLSSQPRLEGDQRDALAVLVALVLVLTQFLGPIGALAALVASPIWFPTLRRFDYARLFFVAMAACVCGALVLWVVNPAEGSYSASNAVGDLTLIARAGVAFGVFVWCRSVLGIINLAFVYGALGLLRAFVDYGITTDAVQLKYHFSWWMVVLLLAFVSRLERRLAIGLMATGVLAIAAIAEYRALVAFLTLSVALLLLARFTARRGQALTTKALGRDLLKIGPPIVLLTYLTYKAVEKLLLGGAFGESLQLKTELQIAQFGSIILGGRAEAPIALGLMRDNPWGYGPGYVPTAQDYYAGAYQRLVDANVNYLDTYSFAGHIKLHSFWGDLWVNAGIAGLCAAGLMLILVGTGLSTALRHRSPELLTIFLCVWGVWHVLFSPIYSNLLEFAFIAAVVARSKSPVQVDAGLVRGDGVRPPSGRGRTLRA